MIKKWILKAVVQKTISFLPFRNRINYFFQKYVTKGVYLSPEYFEDRLFHAANHMAWYKENHGNLNGAKTFELGCGWYPVVPLSLYLNGADELYSIDISRLMEPHTLKTTLDMLVDYHQSGKLKEYYTPIPERMAVLEKMAKNYDTIGYEGVLAAINFTYLVEDLTQLKSVAAGSIDMTHSNNTFEHVYPKVLEGILKKFFEIGKKEGGCHSHFIDMSDHFAHFDKSITIYNFLQFSNKKWNRIDNDIQPQNRLRQIDFEKMYERLNFPVSKITNRPGSLEDLSKVEISKDFENYSKEELAISHCHFYSRVG